MNFMYKCQSIFQKGIIEEMKSVRFLIIKITMLYLFNCVNNIVKMPNRFLIVWHFNPKTLKTQSGYPHWSFLDGSSLTFTRMERTYLFVLDKCLQFTSCNIKVIYCGGS